MIEYPGPPNRWVSKAGKPAACVSVSFGGLPAYESLNRIVVVMESLVGTVASGKAGFPYKANDVPNRILLRPLSYEAIRKRSPSGLAKLHDGKKALPWRPSLYEIVEEGAIFLGSQHELEHRYGLAFTAQANAKAMELLREHLNPQQRIELAKHNYFHVLGPEPEKRNKKPRGRLLWRIRLGTGCEVIWPYWGKTLLSVCFHPEYWLPDADVALATKMLIDSGEEGEDEILRCGKTTTITKKTPRIVMREQKLLDDRYHDLLKL